MPGEPSRSTLIDVTNQQLHSSLSGRLEGSSPDQLCDIISARSSQLRNVADPYGKPTPASRKAVEAGSVTLADGVMLQVDEIEREFTLAISARFGIDEIQSFVLLRSFLYNEGLSSNGGSTDKGVVDELIVAITPFYYSERLFVLRILIPLFRAHENTGDSIHAVATKCLPKILQDGHQFALDLITEYLHKTEMDIPDVLHADARIASRWAKQNMKEQLVVLEVLFWTVWGYVPCDGPLVVRIFEAAYNTNLGSSQKNSTLLLDDEGNQLQHDCAALWILVTVEVLELERVAEDGGLEISATPSDKTFYPSSPESLRRIHEIVTSNLSSQHACTHLAWAFVLSRLTSKAGQLKEIPESYRGFLDSLHPHHNRSKEREPSHVLMARAAFSQEAGLFKLLLTLLTTSPLFVTSVAWKTGSTVTDPNAIAFRSVLKGFVIAMVELVPVELIPDFDSLVEVWIALFGRSEPQSIAGICRQFWQSDWRQGLARRAIFDVARTRFPIHFRPLVRLLRAMTASGFIDTDPLSTAASSTQPPADENDDGDREICSRHVFYYMDKLPTFSLVIPLASCTGPNAVYEKAQAAGPSLAYTNLRAIRLPGGSVMPARSKGRLLSGDGADHIAVCWQHEHSGWKVVLDVLTEYVTRRRMYTGTVDLYQDVAFGRTGPGSVPLTLRLEDVGMEIDEGGDEALATDALDLIRSVIQDNEALAEELLESLESNGDPNTPSDNQPPDLVHLTTMILEEALSRSQARSFSRTQLITSAMSVLSALLSLPKYSLRVWLYIRSTSVLFGPSRTSGFAAVALAAERISGHYTMTLALLNLVQQLLHEAFASFLTIPPDNQRLKQVKEEVLLRAAAFVHGEIWVEHLSWKYAQLGDRFEIGRRVSSFYGYVLKQSPPALGDRPFPALSQAVADALLHKATTSTINPLVSSIAVAPHILGTLYASRRYGDARRLIYLLGSHLSLTRLVLSYKQSIPNSSKPCLLEQALCARVAGGAGFTDSTRSRIDPVDVLANYVKGRDIGTAVPLESIRVLYALCASLSVTQPSPATIIGHLSNPEATVASFVRIVQHPYEDLALRNAVWNFIALAVDKEPALANLFVTGQFRVPNNKSKNKENAKSQGEDDSKKHMSALEVANETLNHWKDLWGANPHLLASVFRFIDVVWQHGLEHKNLIDATRGNDEFWTNVVAVVKEELGPDPDYETDTFIMSEDGRRSSLHEAVSIQSYRIMVKSYAVRVIGQDIFLQPQPGPSEPAKKPLSYSKLAPSFKSEDQLNELILEAESTPYDPSLSDKLAAQLQQDFPGLSLTHLQSQDLSDEREFGDDFTFSIALLHSRLQQCASGDDGENAVDEVERRIASLNLNLSLTYAQTALTESWQFLLRQVLPFVRPVPEIRSNLLSLSATISGDLALEKRSGDMMAKLHGTRLNLLLSILEVVWFSDSDTDKHITFFMNLVDNMHKVLLNEAQPPSQSFLGHISVPFHQTLLQVIYFCLRQCRNLARRPKVLTASRRLAVSGLVDSTLPLVIDALRLTFDSARARLDLDLDRDMELLVAVFEQCTRPDINVSSVTWLTRCQETDVIKSSLELLTRTDVIGLTDLPLLRTRRQPLYAPHILLFHMAVVSIPSGAERFASEGIISAYSNNGISLAASSGQIDVVLLELPGERSPAHKTYCSMIAIVSAVVSALRRQHHFFDAEACGFVQLYGKQIIRALSWSVGDPITLPLLEEMEQVVGLFYALAESAPPTAPPNPAVVKVLRVFTTHALMLLQQLNYALTHPNHIASLLEPVTAEERALLEKEPTAASSLLSVDMADLQKHPLTARLVHRLFRLSSAVVSTLVSISRAYDVLLGEQEEWPVQEAVIVPHSKVVPGEPASLGTLLELANCTLDILRHLVDRPAGQAIAPPASVKETPLDVQEGMLTARKTLEALLVYAATQLAMWLSKPEFDAAEMDSEDHVPQTIDMRESSKRPSRALTDRIRRGMPGEMATDLEKLLKQAKPILQKSIDDKRNVKGDLTQVLLRFMSEWVMTTPS
ncbi:nucleoporin subcomplex protein binding to Pom34-domain-containing protein [Suillus cothurnatus]|nr:nucleoporin subcomplex protein binding to Pom34-domain-containing protein [Suillus cothurnatus]